MKFGPPGPLGPDMLKGGGGIPPVGEPDQRSVGCGRHMRGEGEGKVPGNPNGGGAKPGPPIGGPPWGASMGFEPDSPAAAYEFVMLSITDWAFSWPISVHGFLCQLAILSSYNLLGNGSDRGLL